MCPGLGPATLGQSLIHCLVYKRKWKNVLTLLKNSKNCERCSLILLRNPKLTSSSCFFGPIRWRVDNFHHSFTSFTDCVLSCFITTCCLIDANWSLFSGDARLPDPLQELNFVTVNIRNHHCRCSRQSSRRSLWFGLSPARLHNIKASPHFDFICILLPIKAEVGFVYSWSETSVSSARVWH